MASKQTAKQGEGETEAEGAAEAAHGPQECMPCRGVGTVVSNLGGTPSTVACPWCGGTGKRTPEIDAQQGWLEQSDDGDVSVASSEAA
jgi:DnaJ-class molecular chaperone